MVGGLNELLEELFEPVGGVGLRRMFGGLGVFKDSVMFGLVDDDVLFLKADKTTLERFEAEGCTPWIYQGRHRANVSTSYWRVPERLYDEPDEFREWAIAAFVVAATAKKPKARMVVAKEKPVARKPKSKPKKKTTPKRR